MGRSAEGLRTDQNASAPVRLAVKVLGPVGLWADDQPLELGGTKTKALLARLFIDHNQLVPVEELLDTLWPDTAHQATEVTLRSLVSRLRQRLRKAGVVDDVVLTRTNGYQLRIDPDLVDANRFERLLAIGRSHLTAGDPSHAAMVLSEALALWRGPALDEVRHMPFAQIEVRRLEELRLNAIETRIDAELQLGHHLEMVDLLEALTDEHWSRERLWCQRMLALYRSDRRVEALRVFHQLHARLLRELGVEPGAEVSRLEQAILERSPELERRSSTDTSTAAHPNVHHIPLPAPCARNPRGGFFGRTKELEQLHHALNALSAGDPHQMVFIGGEPGIGKTTLAYALARQAHANGAIVLATNADEEFCAPYQPWAELLTHLVEHAPRDLMEQFAPHVGPLVRMVPRLAEILGTPDTATPADPEAARYTWFSAVQGMLRASGAMAPVVLILDDLQWADVPSLHLLRHVMSSDQPARLLIIGTYREFGVGAIHPLAKLLGDAHRIPNVTRIELRGINRRELQQMMEHAAGRELRQGGIALRDALLAETDGNPFYVGELLHHMIDTGSIRQQNGRWLSDIEFRADQLPVSIREVVGQRVARLGEVARRTLMCASVIGRHFDFRLLAQVSDLNENDLLDVLDSTIEAALVVNTGPSRYSFVHALVEHTIYDLLAPTRRTRLHRRVAEAIEGDAHQQPGRRAIELAHHWAETNDPDSARKAIEYTRAAGDEALRLLAPDEALRWYSQVLALLEQSPDEDELLRCQLRIGIGQAQRQVGNPTFRDTLLAAARMAQRLGSTELLVTAVLANSRGFVSNVTTVDDDRLEMLEAACEAVQDSVSSDRALLLSLLALELTHGGDFARRRELADRALAISRSVGDAATRCGVINNIRQAIEVPETLAERLTLTEEALTNAQALQDPVLHCIAALNRTFTLFQASDVTAGNEVLEQARILADSLGQPTYRWWVTLYEADRAAAAGDLDEAETLATQALEIGGASGQPDIAAFYGGQIGPLRVMQGRSEEVVGPLAQLVAQTTALPGYSIFLAMVHCDLDQTQEARALLEPFVADGFASVPWDVFWLPSLFIASCVVADLSWVETAEVLFERLRPFAEQVAYFGPIRWCQIRYALGRLASTLGRFEEADTFFEGAAGHHAEHGAKWCLALTQLSWGESLAARGTPDATLRAAALLHEALTAARAHGYRQLARRALSALEGIEGPSTPPVVPLTLRVAGTSGGQTPITGAL
jgi:DNA-binding SARP family transcriptional activator/tetratricopeptide (TPR) repeat protein